MSNIFLTLFALAHEDHGHDDHGHDHGHTHEHVENVWTDAWGIFTDPGHFIAEVWFTLVIDFVVIFLGYQLLVKKFVIPRLKKQIHAELDTELGVNHEDGDEHPQTKTDS